MIFDASMGKAVFVSHQWVALRLGPPAPKGFAGFLGFRFRA